MNYEYWLASRYVSSPGSINFNVRVFGTDGSLYDALFCSVSYNGSKSVGSESYGLRPVFHLKPNIKITGGSGTEDDPYILGV